MGITLDKKTGINLKKGSSIRLEKEGKKLEHVCVGLNWGAIPKKALFGMISYKDDVDLDGSVAVFDKDKELIDMVFYNNLSSKDGAIVHSGDDLTGDEAGDDGLDNEVIQIDLKQVSSEVQNIVLFLNSFKQQDFATIPYAKIRIFEGDAKRVDSVLATFSLSADPAYAGFVSMVMGKLTREGDNWKFTSIGGPVKATKIDQTVPIIVSEYL